MSIQSDQKQTANDWETRGKLFHLLGGYMAAQAIYIAAKLGLADALEDGPKTTEELAEETNAHVPSLHRVLRALAFVGLLREVEPRRFELLELGTPLRAGTTDSLRAMSMLFCSEAGWRAYGSLLHTVQTGEPAFEHVHGMAPYAYSAKDPEIAAVFNEAMAEDTRTVASTLVDSYDFSQFRTLVDVGGGNGTLIASILNANPGLRGILFDAPYGLESAAKTLDAEGVADRCQIVEGDFFTSVPEGGDAYLLKAVVHAWDDDQDAQILSNCRRVMPDDGTLLVLEKVMPDQVTEPGITPMVVSDINLLVYSGGHERTESEYRDVITKAGFRITRISPILGWTDYQIIEAVPV